MARFRLQDTDDWQLVHDEQDVRGWPVRDASGAEIGTVEDMIVDDDQERVDMLVLSDGREVRAADVYLGDDAVFLEGTAVGARKLDTVYSDFGRVSRLEGTGATTVYAFNEVEPDYKSHYEQTFASYGKGYDRYKPAYAFGHEMGADERFRDRDYLAAEDDLRTHYLSRYNAQDESAWDEVKDAVRTGYNKTRAKLT